MAAIAASEHVILGYFSSLQVEGQVVIAVSNGAESHVISGLSNAVDLVSQAAKKDGRRCVKLKVNQGFYNPNIQPVLAPLRKWLLANKSSFAPLKKPFYSTATTEKIQPGEHLPAGH
ncbi:hypothetical protein BDQ17DRAFT_1420090 [Cyathus striatus]|nr:hypothetical protein BDQ17DRAFT_1420090 [Cyathus striatus]